jgi:hypothetical protein
VAVKREASRRTKSAALLCRSCFSDPLRIVRVFGVRVLSVRVKFGCDVGSPLPDEEDLTFQFLKGLTVRRSSETSALPECRNCFIFRFLIEFAFESSTDRALHRGDTFPDHSISAPARFAG